MNHGGPRHANGIDGGDDPGGSAARTRGRPGGADDRAADGQAAVGPVPVGGGASIVGSLLQFSGRQHDALFVGQWGQPSCSWASTTRSSRCPVPTRAARPRPSPVATLPRRGPLSSSSVPLPGGLYARPPLPEAIASLPEPVYTASIARRNGCATSHDPRLPCSTFLLLSGARGPAPVVRDAGRAAAAVALPQVPQPRQGCGGLDLTTRAGLLKGGEAGAVVVPGKSADSLLYAKVHDGKMPPGRAARRRRGRAAAALDRRRRPVARRRPQAAGPRKARAGPDWWSLQPIRRPAVPGR